MGVGDPGSELCSQSCSSEDSSAATMEPKCYQPCHRACHLPPTPLPPLPELCLAQQRHPVSRLCLTAPTARWTSASSQVWKGAGKGVKPRSCTCALHARQARKAIPWQLRHLHGEMRFPPPTNIHMSGALIPSSCQNPVLETGWLQTREMYSLKILEARRQKQDHFPQEALRENPSHALLLPHGGD